MGGGWRRAGPRCSCAITWLAHFGWSWVCHDMVRLCPRQAREGHTSTSPLRLGVAARRACATGSPRPPALAVAPHAAAPAWRSGDGARWFPAPARPQANVGDRRRSSRDGDETPRARVSRNRSSIASSVAMPRTPASNQNFGGSTTWLCHMPWAWRRYRRWCRATWRCRHAPHVPGVRNTGPGHDVGRNVVMHSGDGYTTSWWIEVHQNQHIQRLRIAPAPEPGGTSVWHDRRPPRYHSGRDGSRVVLGWSRNATCCPLQRIDPVVVRLAQRGTYSPRAADLERRSGS